MKTVRDFLVGKIRRAEVGDAVRLSEPAAPHPELGLHQGDLAGLGSDAAALRFYAHGIVLPDGRAVRYQDITAIRAPPLEIDAGAQAAIPLPPDAEAVAYAALRWVGRALLRRKLD